MVTRRGSYGIENAVISSAMRPRVLVLGALMAGILGLLFLAGRKPTRATIASVTNTASANPISKRAARIPPATVAVDLEEPLPASPTNFVQRANAGDEDFHLTPEQQAEYLRRFGTNVETLLATQDTNYIKLAAQMFPNDPRVQLAVLTRELFPEQRREWLERFKQSAPDNAIADYLSAREYLRAGDRENAFKDFAKAATKPRFDDYAREQLPNVEDAHLSAGRSLLDAKVAVHYETRLPMATFKGLAVDLRTLQDGYLAAGDMASAESLAQYGRSLSRQLIEGEGSQWVVGQQIGVLIERMLLSKLPPDSQPAFLNGTVQQRLDEVTAYRQSLRPLTMAYTDMMARGNELEIISYFDRLKIQGEYKAMLWLHNREKLR
jgi:hypothetical protein